MFSLTLSAELLTGTAAEVRARRVIVDNEDRPYLLETQIPLKGPSITAVQIDNAPEAA